MANFEFKCQEPLLKFDLNAKFIIAVQETPTRDRMIQKEAELKEFGIAKLMSDVLTVKIRNKINRL